jgi:hypothetical protein
MPPGATNLGVRGEIEACRRAVCGWKLPQEKKKCVAARCVLIRSIVRLDAFVKVQGYDWTTLEKGL